MFVILGLAFLNVFSIGLAFLTMKFDIHAKSTFTNIGIFLTLIGIIMGGTALMILKNFHTLEVNPLSIWPALPNDKNLLPALTAPHEFDHSEWFPLVKHLKLVESCDGIPDPLENCNALEYSVTIDATSG